MRSLLPLLCLLSPLALASDPASLSASGEILHGPVLVEARLEPSGDLAALLVLARAPDGSPLAEARAPRASCRGCAGGRRHDRWSLSALSVSGGALAVDHQGGSGSDAWAWRTEWAWDPALLRLRLARSQRIGPGPDGQLQRESADWIRGVRETAGPGGPALSCRIAPARFPSFESLSAESLVSGAYLPPCVSPPAP